MVEYANAWDAFLIVRCVVPHTSRWRTLAAQTLDANDALVIGTLSDCNSKLRYMLLVEWVVTLADALGAAFNEAVEQRAYCGCIAKVAFRVLF